MPKDCALQREEEEWANGNLLRFNDGKQKVQNLGRNNPRQHYTLRPEVCRKEPCDLMDTKPIMSQQHVLVTC